MTRTRTRAATLGLLIPLALARPGLARDDAPPAPKPSPAAEAARAIVPIPPQAIPDDPPPHEGALIDQTYIIEPPDILVVEAYEALPGRPITGERLVRPDGTISLGFYGDVHVRGLTVPQAKVKVIHHLREFLIDKSLGLIRYAGDPVTPLPPPGTAIQVEVEVMPEPNAPQPPPPAQIAPPPDAKPSEGPKAEPPAPTAPPEATKAAAKATKRQAKRAARREKQAKSAAAKRGEPLVTYAGMQDPAAKPAEPAPKPAAPANAKDRPEVLPGDSEPFLAVHVDPKDSDRVFVDVHSYNSKAYYVQGDVGKPGRIPFTGRETILDALIYAGGLTPTGEANDIHLYRPARGGKPARDYRVDLAAIHRGDVRANLQIFDGDRLVVGRNAIVQKTIEIDRAAAPFSSILNTALQYGFTARTVGPAAGEAPGGTARRDEAIRKWVELFWNLPGGKAEGLDAIKIQEAAPSPAVSAGGTDVKITTPLK